MFFFVFFKKSISKIYFRIVFVIFCIKRKKVQQQRIATTSARMSTEMNVLAELAPGDRVCIDNHYGLDSSHVWIEAPYVLVGWVLEVRGDHPGNRVAKVQLDDDDFPFMVKENALQKCSANFCWPLEQGPRDLKDGDNVIVVGTDSDYINGMRGEVHDFDAKHGHWGVWFEAKRLDACFHVNRLRRV